MVSLMPVQFGNYPRINMPQPQRIDMMGDLVQLADLALLGQEYGRREKDYARRDEEYEEGRRREEAVSRAMQEAGGRVPDAVKILEERGDHDLARQIGTEYSQWRKAMYDEQIAQHDSAFKAFSKASDIVEGYLDMDEAERPPWREIYGQLGKVLPDEIMAEIPREFDDGKLRSLSLLGRTYAQNTQRRREAIEAAEKAREKKQDQFTFDGEAEKILTGQLAYAEDADDWNNMLSYAREVAEVSDQVIQRFGQYSPEAVETLRKRLTQPDSRSAKERYTDAVAGGDEAGAKKWLSAERRWEDAGRKPTDTSMSGAQRGASERELYRSLANLRERASSFETQMSQEQIDQERLEILNVWRTSKGYGRATKIPEPPEPGMILMRAPSGAEKWFYDDEVPAMQNRGAEVVPVPPPIQAQSVR